MTDILSFFRSLTAGETNSPQVSVAPPGVMIVRGLSSLFSRPSSDSDLEVALPGDPQNARFSSEQGDEAVSNAMRACNTVFRAADCDRLRLSLSDHMDSLYEAWAPAQSLTAQQLLTDDSSYFERIKAATLELAAYLADEDVANMLQGPKLIELNSAVAKLESKLADMTEWAHGSKSGVMRTITITITGDEQDVIEAVAAVKETASQRLADAQVLAADSYGWSSQEGQLCPPEGMDAERIDELPSETCAAS